MKGWKAVGLGEVAEFVRGLTFRPSDVVPVGTAGSVACMRTRNVQDALDISDVWAIPKELVKRDEQYLTEGDTLVSSANSWNLVGKCCWVHDLPWRSTFGGFVSVLRAQSADLSPRFLYRWFSSGPVQATVRSFGNQTTNISNLNIERCLGMRVPLPPLDQQLRIVEILDRADALRAKRRAALAQVDGLTQAIFLAMFGDQTSNRWPVGQIGDLVRGFESGRSFEAAPDDASGGDFRVLKVSAVTEWVFRGEESKPVPRDYVPPPMHVVRRGDLLFSRANTSELIGAVALVTKAYDGLLLPDKLWRFLWHEPPMADPEFIRALFRTPGIRREIARRATGTSGSMKNISQEKVLGIPTAIPPLALQRDFARRAAAVNELRASHHASLAQLDALFASLQHRAIRGEL